MLANILVVNLFFIYKILKQTCILFDISTDNLSEDCGIQAIFKVPFESAYGGSTINI